MESLYVLLLIALFLYLNQQFVFLKKRLTEQDNQLLALQKALLAQEPTVAGTEPATLPPNATLRPVVPLPVVPPAAPVSPAGTPPLPVPQPAGPPPQPFTPPPVIPNLEPVLVIRAPEPAGLAPGDTRPNLLDESFQDSLESTPPTYKPDRPAWYRRFLDENPDLEKFIGENLINKIGIAILVAGIGYFVRYAIAQEWIGELGRVLIGVVAGGALLTLAHRMRQQFAAFSSVLVAGGLSVLYFTIAIAFSDYRIFSQTAAFALMVLITGFAVALSIAYNRVELAVMSLIGGFATPFMVNTGQSNYVVLFTYILILDVGMLVLASLKKWPLVHWVAYGFTVLLYGSWLFTDVLIAIPLDGPTTVTTPPYWGAFVFATIFYSLFAATNLFDRLRQQTPFTATDIGLFLSNTALYYAAGMGILAEVDQGSWQGVFTMALAVVNFGYAALIRRRSVNETTLFYLLIGLVITFASLTVPVQLDGNYITMFWSLEAVLLLWLSQRSGLRLMATASLIVLGLMVLNLQLNWNADYNTVREPPLRIVFNPVFVTSVIAVVGLVAYAWQLRKQTGPVAFFSGNLPVAALQRAVGYVAVVVAYLAGFLELLYQLSEVFGGDPNKTILIGTYNLAVAALALTVTLRGTANSRVWVSVVFSLGVVLLYLVSTGPSVLDLLDSYAQGRIPSRAAFPFQYVNLVLLGVVLTLLFRAKERLMATEPLLQTVWPWFLVVAVVTMASLALFATVLYLHFPATDVAATDTQRGTTQLRYDALVAQINKVGLPILWGVCAFAFMYVGLVRRNRTYRVLSLALFTLTLLKLFIYDIRGISEGGRILAFISLGVLLLIISFMYQRIKRLLATDN